MLVRAGVARPGVTTMFRVEDLVRECEAAVRERQPHLAVREVLARVLADPASVAAVLVPERAELTPLHVSDAVTVLKVVWAPGMTVPPHDHRTWAAIGVYEGHEDNAFFRRGPGGLVPSGGTGVDCRDVLLLGDDVIHAVSNPLRSFTGGIHVYGGDFLRIPRSEWDPDTMEERPHDGARAAAHFEEANRRLADEATG